MDLERAADDQSEQTYGRRNAFPEQTGLWTLLKGIPELLSLRNSLWHFQAVKDETEGRMRFLDYGLYNAGGVN